MIPLERFQPIADKLTLCHLKIQHIRMKNPVLTEGNIKAIHELEKIISNCKDEMAEILIQANVIRVQEFLNNIQ